MLSLNNDSIDLIYPHEFDIKDTTDSMNSASYLDLQLEYDNQQSTNTKITSAAVFVA